MDDRPVFNRIRQWGIDRGIVANSTPTAQFLKTVEEVGELSQALAKGRTADAVDAIGDIIVTLTLVSRCMGVDVEFCIEAAWDQIKDRRGYLTPEGVFVKEEAK
jgi:NTP pyrophosphatase (non-canonical NTP hydrolase)